MAWLDDALARLGVRGFNIPGVVGVGQAAQTPGVGYPPSAPVPPVNQNTPFLDRIIPGFKLGPLAVGRAAEPAGGMPAPIPQRGLATIPQGGPPAAPVLSTKPVVTPENSAPGMSNMGPIGYGSPQQVMSPPEGRAPLLPSPSRPSLFQAFMPGGMIPKTVAPASGFDPAQPDAIGWNKAGQLYGQGAVAAGGGPPKTPYGDWSSGVGRNVGDFTRGLFGLAPPDNAPPPAPAASVPPTKPVATAPVAITPAGPAPVTPAPASATAYPDRAAFEHAMNTQFPGQYKGPDGITLGMPPAAAPAAPQAPLTFEQATMQRYLTTPNPEERARMGQILATLHSPQAEANRRLQGILEKTYNDTRASLEAQRSSGALRDDDFEKKHQDAIKEYTKGLKEIAAPGTIPYDQN